MTFNASHAEHISNLITSEGWEIMSTWLEGKITYHKAQLLTCKLEEVEKHRNMITAYKSALSQPQEILNEVAAQSVEQHS